MRIQISGLCCMVLIAFGWSSPALARNTYLTAWENRYPTSTLPDRMASMTGSQCNVCHHPPNRSTPGNCYRIDLIALLDGEVPIAEAIEQLDGMDSDGDGVSNGEEAVAPRSDLPGEVGYNMGLIGDLGTDPCADNPNEVVTGVPETPPAGCTGDPSCDDGDACTDDQCVDGSCVYTPNSDPCDDGDACTGNDQCAAGSCAGTAVDCSGAGDPCNTASCDPGGADGNCDILTPVPDGTACDDGDACTETDQCAAGSCAGTAVDCSGAGDPCNTASCNPGGADGNCDILTPVPDGTACDDGDACTETDQCAAGSCAGTAVDCSGAGDQCNTASCDPGGADGNCNILTPVPDGTVCDDGDACTDSDQCAAGSCAGTAVDCSAAGDQCNTASCDPGGADGNCDILTPVPDGTVCDDGDACTDSDQCAAGSCAGTAVDCSAAGDQCNTASCDPGGADGNCDILTPVPDGTVCDDGDACTETDQCAAGSCAGTAVDCSAAGDPCNTASCDPGGADGNCAILTPVPDGTSCDDSEACTETDQCAAGSCAGTAVDCSGAGDPCNTASCDPGGADGNCDILTPVPDGTACDDGDACTETDQCAAGSCAGTAVDCSAAGDPCNTASCDPGGADGNCAILTPVPDGTSCDDSEACTETDQCAAGSCAGTAVDCSGAGDPCNTASCDPGGADGNCDILTPVPDGTACDDGDACTETDQCAAGSCAGTAVDCSGAGDQCNTASCAPSGGNGNCDILTPVPDGTSCDDGDACTTDDACNVGECSGVLVDCPEGETCDPETGECVAEFCPCPTDVDGNGVTDAADLAVLLGAWGVCGPGEPCECLDSDGNGIIDASDLAVLLGNWGPCQ